MPKKTVHVHLHDAPTRDSDDGGRWVTISGTHVHIGEGGKIDKGPKVLMDKSEHEAHAHLHNEAGNHHADTAKAKGKDHPDTKYHEAAAREHWHAGGKFAGAHIAAERGDVKHARKLAAEAEGHAASAAEHERTLATPAKQPKQESAPAKPAAHEKLHGEAAENVKGSEKHEAEHKRLMGLYDSSRAAWERNAVNRLVENNATAALQHRADAAHELAAKHSDTVHKFGGDDVEKHRDAQRMLEDAIALRGKAGGPGYAKKQEELAAMKKRHDSVVGRADAAAQQREDHIQSVQQPGQGKPSGLDKMKARKEAREDRHAELREQGSPRANSKLAKASHERGAPAPEQQREGGPLKKGERVRIKPEFQDAGDDAFEWHAGDDESGGRVTIHSNALGDASKFRPSQVVHSHMVERHKK